MNETTLIGKYFASRAKAVEKYDTQAEEIQQKVMQKLVRTAAQTEWGTQHHFDQIHSYEDFARAMQVNTYEELKGYIDRMRHGEKDILWPGQVRWYAKSSGTTNDKSKFIPVSKQGLKDTHYMGGTDAVALYLRSNPKSRLFSGRALILGGSHASNYNVANSLVGDLSAILIDFCCQITL